MAHTSGAHTYVRAHATWPARIARATAVIAGVLIAGGAAAQTMTPVVAPTVDPTAETIAPDQLDFSLLDDATREAPITSAPLAPPSDLASQSATIGSRTYRMDGSVALSAGQRLSTPWDARVGVDLAAPAGPGEDHGTGWANVAVPAEPIGLDKATIDARVDPSSDQGKLSTALTRSMPIGGGLSLTLQNGYSVTQTLANPNGMLSPVNPRVYSGDGGVKLEFPTATALSAGARMSSFDDRLTPSLSAEQKLFELAAQHHGHDQPAADRRDRPQHHGGIPADVVRPPSTHDLI